MSITIENSKITYCGTLVQTWRKRRKLSRSALATATGISSSTINNWETGRFLPRLPEFSMVMKFLGVPSSTQQEAIQQLQRPRALHWLRHEAPSSGNWQLIGVPPSLHDLLRSLRVRAGRTIEEVADHLQISRRTLMRWENGDTWPEDARLHALCYYLNAHPDELAALSERDLIRGTHRNLRDATLLELTDAFMNFRQAPHPPEKMALADLTYLALAAAVWPHAGRTIAGTELLFYIYAELGSYHALAQRTRAARTYLERVLTYMESAPRWPEYGCLTVARYAYIQPTPNASRQALEKYLPGVAPYPAEHGWLLMLMGRYLVKEDRPEASDLMSKRSLVVAERASPLELMLRRCDRVSLLADLGRPGEAYPLLLPLKGAEEPILPTLWAKTAAVSGDRDDALAYYRFACDRAASRSLVRADLAPYYNRALQETLTFIERY